MSSRGGREFPTGCQTIIDVYHGESPACKVHAIALVDLLAAVNEAAAVDVDDDRTALGTLGMINVQQIPLSVGTVGNVAMLGDTAGQGDQAVPLPVTFTGADAEEDTLKGHGETSFGFLLW